MSGKVDDGGYSAQKVRADDAIDMWHHTGIENTVIKEQKGSLNDTQAPDFDEGNFGPLTLFAPNDDRLPVAFPGLAFQ